MLFSSCFQAVFSCVQAVMTHTRKYANQMRKEPSVHLTRAQTITAFLQLKTCESRVEANNLESGGLVAATSIGFGLFFAC